MIELKNLSKEKPYLIFKEKYLEALESGQKNIEAISVSSFNKNKNEVESRFVNLKLIENDNFIFFTNYNSPKAISFKSHNQVSALIYWPLINTQIRIKAIIEKTPKTFNDKYFNSRCLDKNALAISSEQSKEIESFDEVVLRFKNAKENLDLKNCPNYWGGFSLKPYEIEFWEGNKFRLNKRNLYKYLDGVWSHYILQP
tara:strand:+ start:332 stop:928 length:597 start_codon:yes stop_codon:yes gene_type:complete